MIQSNVERLIAYLNIPFDVGIVDAIHTTDIPASFIPLPNGKFLRVDGELTGNQFIQINSAIQTFDFTNKKTKSVNDIKLWIESNLNNSQRLELILLATSFLIHENPKIIERFTNAFNPYENE